MEKTNFSFGVYQIAVSLGRRILRCFPGSQKGGAYTVPLWLLPNALAQKQNVLLESILMG
jgi:hypothetical protein